MRTALHRSVLSLALLWLGGCPTNPGQDLGMPPPDLAVPVDLAPVDLLPPADLAVCRTPACLRALPPQPLIFGKFNDLDILFLIDNSPSMSPKQRALAAAIPQFIQKIESTGANYQVGVASSDVGSWVAKGTPWPTALGSCNSFEGDDGRLQREACNVRSGLTNEAITACQQLCPDPKFVPQGGQGFIRRVNGQTNVPMYLENGRDIGPQRAFQCIGLLGDAGCGIENTLEGARRALDGHLASNSGFLRPGSVLGVIFLTDEDDCSVSLPGRVENDPMTRDCAVADKNASWDCFNPDYRCLARSTECSEALNTPGFKTACRERPASYLEPVSTYVNFFKQLRPESKLLIGGIWALPALSGAGVRMEVDYLQMGTRSSDLNRAIGARAACVSATDPNIFGRPQHRLSKFIKSFVNSTEVSICDTAGYAGALDQIAAAITGRAGAQCLDRAPLQVSDNGRLVPVCLVGDVSDATPNAVPAQPMPLCSSACCDAWSRSAHPAVDDVTIAAACAAEGTDACYCAAAAAAGSPAAQAGVCAGKAIAGVWRKGGASQPAGTVTSFRCMAP